MPRFSTALLLGSLLAGTAGLSPAQMPNAAGQPLTASPLSLDQAWARALAANPQLKLASLERDAAQARQSQAALPAFNPELSFESEQPRTAAASQSLRLEQTLEIGGQRRARMGVAKADLAQSEAELHTARRELAAQVYTRFGELLLAQESLRLAEDNAAIAEQALSAARLRVQAGKAPPLEASRAEVLQLQTGNELALAQSRLPLARQALSLLWLSREPDFAKAAGALNDSPALAAPGSASPRLQAAQAALGQREAELRLLERESGPTLTVSAGLKRSEERGEDATLVGISLPLPLLNRNQGRRREALLRIEQARMELSALSAELEAQGAEAAARLQAASTELSALQDRIRPAAEEAFRIASEGYRLGKFNFLDVLDAERSLLSVRQQWLDSARRAQTARADLARLQGFAGPSFSAD